MRQSLLLQLIAICLLCAGCFPSKYVKAGDRAASTGNWKDAEAAYRQALYESPDDQEIRNKYSNAKQNAVAQAMGIAHRCLTENDHACAERETSYVLGLVPEHAKAAEVRVQARRGIALAKIVEANELAAGGKYLAALKALQVSLRSDAADVRAKAAEARTKMVPDILRYAAAEEQRLSTASMQAQFVGLSDVVAILDLLGDEEEGRAILMRVRPNLEAARTAYAKEKGDEGHSFASKSEWMDAARSFAEAARADSRLQVEAEFADSMTRAERAIAARNYIGATSTLEAAVKMGSRYSGLASRLLEKVRPQNYELTIEKVAVTPYIPGTNPQQTWVGEPSGNFGTILQVAASVTGYGLLVADQAKQIGDALEKISREHRPRLIVNMTLPDGRQVKTIRFEPALFVNVGASVVVNSNAYDRRAVLVQVSHDTNGKAAAIGSVTVPLGDLIAGKSIPTVDGILALSIVPNATREPVGLTKGLALVNADNKAKKPSVPKPGSIPFRLRAIEVDLTAAHDDGLMGGAPDPYLKIKQGGDVVFKSTTAQDTRTTRWTLSPVIFFVTPGETLTVEAWNAEWGGDSAIAAWPMSVSDLAKGEVSGTTPDGSKLTMEFEAVSTGPQ